ncbi:MAG: PTS glucose transporter subunit IIA [Spirochaetales bacterium]|nr:PTS glucose transporter subunit IIA [Spirochaetales bacterium]
MEQQDAAKKYINILSPVEGEIVPLDSISDPAFSTGIMGLGAAIVPSADKVFSPVSGVVDTVFETLHAIGLKSDDGLDILIHVGQNTVELKGKCFKCYVKEGQRIEAGDPLLKFNLKKIKKLGYDITTPITITNSDEYSEILPVVSGRSVIGEPLIKIKK